MPHTPGPWEISLREMLDGWVIVVDRDGGIVANVNTETGPNIPPLVSRKMPAGANAALIAAAPDLLEALEAIKDKLEAYDPTCPFCQGNASSGHRYTCIWHIANAATRKARRLYEARDYATCMSGHGERL